MTFTLLSLLGLGCSEYGYTSKVQKDVFQQVRRNTVDILLVIDNSCSMIDEQEKLSTNFESFIDAFANVDVDWQIGVVTTDTQIEDAGVLVGGSDAVRLEDSEGRTIDQVKWNRDWNIPAGASLQLSSDAYSPTSNTNSANWCAATVEFGDGDLGTPGAPNQSCSGGEDAPSEGSSTEPAIPPSVLTRVS